LIPESGHRHFHEQLAELKSTLLEMSGLAEEQVAQSLDAMFSDDPKKAQAVIDLDERIDELELELDRVAHELLALQQPMAGDLRFITMAMKISNDLERVGDHAVSIARAAKRTDMLPFHRTPELAEMARIAGQMLSEALDSFVRGDSEQARRIRQSDEQVDRLYNSVFRVLLTHMMEDPRWIGPAMSLLLISRNLERIGDLATNIAEDVVFMVEGVVIRHEDKAETAAASTSLEEPGG
jgi:phosphate transport system protein